MVVPLCMMVPMPVVRLAFKIDISKMEQAFHMGYREGTRFFICLQQAGRARNRICFTLWNMGWALGHWKWAIWKGAMGRPKLGVLFQQYFFTWDRTIASRLGCHTLAYCTMLIHHGTYLQILFYLTLLKGLWSCSQPWLTWTSKTFSFGLIFENMVFFCLSPKSKFLSSCVGALSLIMSSQAWCTNFFKFRGLEFKHVLLVEVYMKCESKSKKTWHSLTSEAFFHYMYKVIVFPSITLYQICTTLFPIVILLRLHVLLIKGACNHCKYGNQVL